MSPLNTYPNSAQKAIGLERVDMFTRNRRPGGPAGREAV
jgi:hypothetical protein